MLDSLSQEPSYNLDVDMGLLDDLPDIGEFMAEQDVNIANHLQRDLPPPLVVAEMDSMTDEFSRRADYTIKVIRTAPSSIVLENQTPWSHPLLYKDEMPRSIQGKPFCM
jgi:hypothetical protein